MNLLDLQKMDFEGLKSFLADPSTIENRKYDFMKMLPPDSNGKQGLRELFCAWANSKGGAIFFGIKDDFSLAPLPRSDFRKLLADIVDVGIMPSIQNWDVIKVIDDGTGKFFYIVYVKESPYFDKPHITGEKIIIRKNGYNETIKDGIALRRMLELDKFSAICVEALEEELKKMKAKRAISKGIDAIYLLQLEAYLEDKSNVDGQFQPLLTEFREVVSLYTQINSEESIDVSSVEGGNVLGNEISVNKRKVLGVSIDTFIINYKEAHKGYLYKV